MRNRGLGRARAGGGRRESANSGELLWTEELLEGSFIPLVQGEPFFVRAINKQTSESNESSHSLMRALLLLP